jgi:hypothetical protein
MKFRVLFFALMMEAVRTSETSVCSNETTRRYMPEETELHSRRRENLKSHNGIISIPNSMTAVELFSNFCVTETITCMTTDRWQQDICS